MKVFFLLLTLLFSSFAGVQKTPYMFRNVKITKN